MATVIVPVAKGMYLCDYVIGAEKGKVDLYGLFNAIGPQDGYPYTRGRFCVFAQLVGGQGKVPFFVDIRYAPTDELVYLTETKALDFPDRETIVQMAVGIEGCTFEKPGLYLLELFCDNQWVCDARLLLKP